VATKNFGAALTGGVTGAKARWSLPWLKRRPM
jgi:hypothetical protein